MMKKTFISLLAVFYIVSAFSDDNQNDNQNTVIIKNEASSATQQQAVTAPVLVPSPAKKLRDVREQQEIKTEDIILKELEKQRLLDEQKRVDKLLGRSAEKEDPSSNDKVISSPQPAKGWVFGNKSFISFGPGVVSYPGTKNVNSTETPAGFFSFGGYGYNGNVIFDLSVYYSKHYLRTTNKHYVDAREVVDQPAFSMSVKYSPLSGQVKPYMGLSGSVVWRKWGFVHKSGAAIQNDALSAELKDVADKVWNQSFDAGLALGMDIALGSHLGLSLDIRYHWNLYTENRPTANQILTEVDVLDERDSLIMSGNLRYYF